MSNEILVGKVSKKNEELEYGFVTVPKLGDVFFNLETVFENISYVDVVVGQKVKIKITETPRGLFANSVSLLN